MIGDEERPGERNEIVKRAQLEDQSNERRDG